MFYLQFWKIFLQYSCAYKKATKNKNSKAFLHSFRLVSSAAELHEQTTDYILPFTSAKTGFSRKLSGVVMLCMSHAHNNQSDWHQALVLILGPLGRQKWIFLTRAVPVGGSTTFFFLNCSINTLTLCVCESEPHQDESPPPTWVKHQLWVKWSLGWRQRRRWRTKTSFIREMESFTPRSSALHRPWTS